MVCSGFLQAFQGILYSIQLLFSYCYSVDIKNYSNCSTYTSHKHRGQSIQLDVKFYYVEWYKVILIKAGQLNFLLNYNKQPAISCSSCRKKMLLNRHSPSSETLFISCHYSKYACFVAVKINVGALGQKCRQDCQHFYIYINHEMETMAAGHPHAVVRPTLFLRKLHIFSFKK